jgi:hypothetical protein
LNYLALILGGSLPMGVLIFVGSYFGIWRKNTVKLPWGEVIGIFIGSWVLAIVLQLGFQVILSGQDPQFRQVFGGLWGPLVVGILIGRKFTSWRREKIKEQAGTAPAEPTKG